MPTFLIFIYVLVSILLVGFILLQQGKGSDIGSAFGSGASNTMFGPNSSLSPLAKITAVLALIFLVLGFYLTFQSRTVDKGFNLQEEIIESEEGILTDTLPE